MDGYVFEADGLATQHFSEFLSDPEFIELYGDADSGVFADYGVDFRWRLWILAQLARHCSNLPGAMAEFGVYKGACAKILLGLTPDCEAALYLFDTFSGIPGEALTESERSAGFEGRLGDTSPERVAERLERWSSRVRICSGDVNRTLKEVETGPLAFVHVDLNASKPTAEALAYAYPRLIPGAVMLFDDYGFVTMEEQREVIDFFFETRPERPVALPTGQAFAARLSDGAGG